MAQTSPGTLYITAPDEEPRTVLLDEPVLRIGRLPPPENDLYLAHARVSRRHAQIFCDRLPYRIVDLDSSNGTTVNDAPLPPNQVRELRDQDVIAIGPFTIRYQAPQMEPPSEPKDTSEQASQEPPQEEATPPPDPEPEADLLAGLKLEDAPAPPPPEEPPPQAAQPDVPTFGTWVGMPRDHSRWLQYLPWIYSEHPFLGRYLLIFEDLFGPLDQAIAHFDLFLDPRTAPESYLAVLADWLGLVLADRWPADQRRAIVPSVVELYDFRGTQKGMIQLLEACTRCTVEIDENVDGPHSFRVTLLPQEGQHLDQEMIRYLIETNKPAHTVYTLQIERASQDQ